MKIFALLLLIPLTVSAQSTPKNCPPTLVVQALDKTGKNISFFLPVVQRDLFNVIQTKLKEELQIVTGGEGDFSLMAQLSTFGSSTLFEATLASASGQVLGKIQNSYTTPNFQPILEQDCKAAAEKFASILAAKVVTCKPITAQPPQDTGKNVDKLCLSFKGDSGTNMKVPQTGTNFNWKSKGEGEISLVLQPDGKTISGSGKITLSTDTDLVATRLNASGGGKAAPTKSTASANGQLIPGNIAKLHIVAQNKKDFDFSGQAHGKTFSLPYYQGGFDMELEIPFHAGATKTMSKTWNPAPGYDMTNSYLYVFTLKACQ